MKRFPLVLMVAALGAAGFAAASIASGGRLVHMLTGTDATVTVATTTTETTTTETGEHGGGTAHGRRVAMCHHTGSKKHPFHTISVDQHAVAAHLRHHDTLGACAPASTAAATAKPTVTTPQPAGDHGAPSGDHGKSGDDHGSSGGDHGKGHGKP